MASGKYLQHKFQAWARRRGIMLQGSEGRRGEPNYTLTLRNNLYEDLSDKARQGYEQGNGNELTPNAHAICRMQALHSSAAMVVNLFDYWISRGLYKELAQALGIPAPRIKSLSFEQRYPVIADYENHGFNAPPHLDVGVNYDQDTQRVTDPIGFYPTQWEHRHGSS